MDFAQGREEFVEEDDQMVMNDRIRKHQQPNFTYSSSSPSSLNLMTNNAQMGSWLGTRFDPDEDNNSRSSPDHNNPEPARQEPGEDYASIEKEHMFDKVVTPSDVGKLNRLVIPKQHAEKYFPLDSSTNEKGLLLNFEDRDGKPWRFRYSYWNSSQSYVMTKGWSRFVKEKKLDAGDIVSFQRGVGEAAKDRLFIDWRRRPDSLPVGPHDSVIPGQYYRSIQYPWPASATSFPPSQILYRPGTVMMARDRLQLSQLGNVNVHSNNNSNNNNNSYMVGGTGYGYGNVVYLRSNAAVAAAAPPPVRGVGSSVVFESVPVVQGKAAAKRLRLFGVNMDCPISESDEECEILSSTSISHGSMVAPPPSIQFSSPAATQQQYPIPHPAVQLRLYNGMPLMSSKGKQASRSSSSSMSLDLDIN